MIENYLKILEESLTKKVNTLQSIEEENRKQEQSLKGDVISWDDFDQGMERKEELIKELNRLDQGFDQLYERIKEQLLQNKEIYKKQIENLQQLIQKITDLSVSVQAQEMRNKQLVERAFVKAKREMQTGRQSSKAAYDYYRNMNNSNITPPQFMDQKK